MGFAALSPHLGQPRAANPCTVFRVGFAVGVDLEQSCDNYVITIRPEVRVICGIFGAFWELLGQILSWRHKVCIIITTLFVTVDGIN